MSSKFKNKHLFIGIIIIIILLVTGYFYYKYNKEYPSTDNAYVNADKVNITSQVNGKVTKIYINDNQKVSKGDLLFEIDPSLFQEQLNEVKAKLKIDEDQIAITDKLINISKKYISEKEASYQYALTTYSRYTKLNNNNIITDQEEAEATQNIQEANSELQIAILLHQQAEIFKNLACSWKAEIEPKLKIAELNLAHTKIYAPSNGYISNCSLSVGDYVTASTPLFALIDNSKWWIDANFKESDLARIKIGDTAKVYIDMYGISIDGNVESISYGSGSSFSLLPAENATGNWVKVIQRFTVRISVKNDINTPLRVGSSATVTINTLTQKGNYDN